MRQSTTDSQDSTEPFAPIEAVVAADDPLPLTFVAALFLGPAIGYGFGRSQVGSTEQGVVTATPAEEPAGGVIVTGG